MTKSQLGKELESSKVVRERFALRRRLGEGGFGVVYEAFDRDRQATVALKSLHRAEPQALLRFKREFRTLADISHRNLVQLFELIADGDQWFLTMEYVDGVTFLGGVSVEQSDEFIGSGNSETLELLVPETGPISMDTVDVTVDPDRMRSAVRQLAKGLNALHDRGILHRDIKPSNVLVADDGRLVVLDFGMVAELRPRSYGPGESSSFVGTPHYTSPEQAMGQDATEASDWYSVGVMLFEAMTGRFPVDGRTVVQILLKKQKPHVPDYDEFPENAPFDLVELCRSLLRANPMERPTGRDIINMLQVSEVSEAAIATEEIFVGRVDELAELDYARRRTRTHRKPGVVNVSGQSGMGKTALVRQFLSTLDDDVVLSARCYENETVPFKAIDGLVDDIFGHLKSLSSSERADIIDGIDIEALARLFPVMKQLLRDEPAEPIVGFDQMLLRQRAFDALRALLDVMCDHYPVVLWIDDAQWGDRDSAALIAELIRGSDSPPVLWVTTYRSEEVEESAFLSEWALTLAEHRDHVDISSVPIGELTSHDAHELASALLDGEDPETSELITREAKGHPLFIDELARFRGLQRKVDSSITSLDDFIRHRFDNLDVRSRKLLEAVAVAGQPIEWNAARDVARLGESAPAVFARLRNDRLLRVNARETGEFVETYHDRIRETVRDALAEDRRVRYHIRIAETLETLAADDYDRLLVHFREGAEPERAASYAVLAAEKAMGALAFEKAIVAYQEALSLKKWSEGERLDFLEKIGDANAYLARGNEAAEAYREASRLADSEEVAIDLERRSAEQLIRCGQLERGMASMNQVMEHLDLPVPNDSTILLAIVWRAFLFWLRGDDYEIDDEPIGPMTRAKVDACWSIANLMATIDVRRGAYFQLVNLTESLDSGDATAITRALGLQAVHDATTPKNRERAQDRLAEARSHGDNLRDPYFERSWLSFAAGLTDYMAGDFAPAIGHFDDAVELLEKVDRGNRWEAASIELYSLQCLYFCGELGEFSALAERLLDEAERARDFLHLIAVGLWSHAMYLAIDAPREAQEHLDEAIAGWAQQDFHLQDFWYAKGSVNVAIYRGDGRRAHELMLSSWSDVGKAMILRSETGLTTAWDARLRAAIAAAVETGSTATARKELKRARRALSKWKPKWGMAILSMHEAQIAIIDGDARALERLAEAESSCDAAGMRFWTLGARFLVGMATSGQRGETLRESVVAELDAEGVVDPIRFLSIFAPAIRSLGGLLSE